MKDPYDYGIYPWWPKDGLDQFHPDDVEQASDLIPSDRIFRREGTEGPYIVLQYGHLRVRLKPGLFQPIRGEGFDLGDDVEVLSRSGKNDPSIGTIREMRWHAATREIHYYLLDHADSHLPAPYTAGDLRHVENDISLS